MISKFSGHDLSLQRSPFSTPTRSLLSIVTYSTGGYNYNGIFRLGRFAEDREPNIEIPFPAVSYFLWIIFIVVMPILLNNLLVGTIIRYDIVRYVYIVQLWRGMQMESISYIHFSYVHCPGNQL